jgi:hypothetical protein
VAERRAEPGAIVERVIESLRSLPPVDAAAVARAVDAAARARTLDASPNEDDLLDAPRPDVSRWPQRTAIAAAAVLAVALTGVEVWRKARITESPTPVVAAPAPVTVAATSAEALEAVPVPTQFVFDGRARRVTLVGDFNNWDDRATPLEREPGSTLWSVTVPIQRGRHIYAFMVDSIWTVDKRAPVARDPDFGITGSVVLVGRQ